MLKKFYVTTPIYYVNDSPHIGHAYTTLAADFITRFKKLDGYDTHFLTGTDEHGQKIEKAAIKAGVTPQQFTDQLSVSFRELSVVMNFANDDFIRTTEIRHKNYVQKIWQQLVDKNYIYLGKYSGWYATRDEAFYAESELIEGKAPTGADVEWVEEESYFFRLSAFQDKLLDFYQQNHDFIEPVSRRNEVLSFVNKGLIDLSVSRTSFAWGIPVPGNPKHVIYVWLDALFNYISALGEDKKNYWPCDVHIVGKDILRFHAVYWPAFLMALEIPLPKKVFAHGWWTNDGEKISKSVGNVINPLTLIEKYGVDYVRYFLMREISFGNDGNYSESAFITRVNAELVNNIGNLVQRVLSLIYNYCEAKIPEVTQFESADQKMLDMVYSTIDAIRINADKYELNCMLGVIVDVATAANVYIDQNAPWQLRKTDIERMYATLYTLVECIRIIAILLQPIIPHSAKQILESLGLYDVQTFLMISKDHALKAGAEIQKPTPIFPRIEV